MGWLTVKIKTLWRRFSAPASRFETLKEILSDKDNLEFLMGVQNQPPISDSQLSNKVLSDAGKVLMYTRSPEYKVYAQEVWANVIKSLDTIMNPDTKDREVDFHRGSMAAHLEDLRISYRAKKLQEEMKAHERAIKNGTN